MKIEYIIQVNRIDREIYVFCLRINELPGEKQTYIYITSNNVKLVWFRNAIDVKWE